MRGFQKDILCKIVEAAWERDEKRLLTLLEILGSSLDEK